MAEKKKAVKKKTARKKSAKKPPKNDDSIDDGVVPLVQELKKAEENRQKTLEIAQETIKKFEEIEGWNFSVPEGLAMILRSMDHTDEPGISESAVSWTIEKYVYSHFDRLTASVHQVHEKLVEKRHDREMMYSYNDLDNHIFYVGDPSHKAWVTYDQNSNYLVILKDYTFSIEPGEVTRGIGYNVYKLWVEFDEEALYDWEQDFFRFSGQPGEPVLRAKYLDRYSDNFPANSYVSKPDIKWFEEHDFDLEKIRMNSTGSQIRPLFEVGGMSDYNKFAFTKLHEIKSAVWLLDLAREEILGTPGSETVRQRVADFTSSEPDTPE